jgi:hypothetical protein
MTDAKETTPAPKPKCATCGLASGHKVCDACERKRTPGGIEWQELCSHCASILIES